MRAAMHTAVLVVVGVPLGAAAQRPSGATSRTAPSTTPTTPTTPTLVAPSASTPVATTPTAGQAYRATNRYGYRGLVLGETTLPQIREIIGEPMTCLRMRRPGDGPTAPDEVSCAAATSLTSPQKPMLYFLNGRLRGAHILMPRDKVLEVVSAQVAQIFPGPGESLRFQDGRRAWRSDPACPVIVAVTEVRVRPNEPVRLAVAMSDRRVPWPGEVPHAPECRAASVPPAPRR